MPLPLTVSCFSKIQIDFTFLVPAHPVSPGKRAVKRVYVCCEIRIFHFMLVLSCTVMSVCVQFEYYYSYLVGILTVWTNISGDCHYFCIRNFSSLTVLNRLVLNDNGNHFTAINLLRTGQPVLRTGGFCWSRVLLSMCPYKQQIHCILHYNYTHLTVCFPGQPG